MVLYMLCCVSSIPFHSISEPEPECPLEIIHTLDFRTKNLTVYKPTYFPLLSYPVHLPDPDPDKQLARNRMCAVLDKVSMVRVRGFVEFCLTWLLVTGL